MKRITIAGFTLVELLVVISIISILAAVTVSNLNDSRAAARDVKRVSDMEAIEGALFLFYQANGSYPGPAEGILTGQMIGTGSSIDDALRPYLSEVPIDPRHDAGNGDTPDSGAQYFYAYDPAHPVDTTNCLTTSGPTGVVFGFNSSEVRGAIRQDTCQGSELNLNTADYNKALFPTPN